MREVPVADSGEPCNTFDLLTLQNVLVIVVADPAEWRGVPCGYVVLIELTGLHGSDDITYGHSRRCVELVT